MSACDNPSATPEMLTNVYQDGTIIDLNLRRKPLTFAWGLIFRLFEIVVRLRLATSEFATGMAHSRRETALHTAARNGHTPLVKWLLDNGARPSLHVENAMGCTPLDISLLFGPFPETEAVLTRAILKERAVTSTSEPEETSSVVTVGAPLLYPMYLLPVRTLLDLSVLPPHEELLAQDKLVEWRPTMRSVFYVSLEWTSNDHPDPGGKRLDVLKRLLSKMVQGRASKVDADFGSQATFRKSLKITSADWRELASDAHIWINFCSVPTVPSASMEASLRSFSGYIEQSTHFLALCPPTKFENVSNRTCDFRSWCDRGWVRVELSSLLMAVTPKPAVLITGDDSAASTIDVSRFAMALSPGQGRFDCCGYDHQRITNDGVSMPIPCEKPMAGQLLMDLLERRIDHHQQRSEWDELRLWKAFSPRFLRGLGVETQAVPTTPEAFLREFEFVHDEADPSPAATSDRQSKRGVSPLFLAVVSGNLEVSRALARSNPADVTARLKSDFPTLGLWTGCEPIHAAAAACVTDHVPIITALLEGGADPNAAAGKVGITPLYAAAAMARNLEGVRALVSVAGDRLKMEKENRVVSDTALGGAAYFSTPAIVDVLLAANAKVGHIVNSGATKLMFACYNPSATPDMLASLCHDGTIDVCHRRRARTFFWALVMRLFEMAVWLNILTSNVVMGFAHMRGATALHAAAQRGHTSIVRWLLDHGARRSLHVKNAMGCTPRDVARLFGPFPETSALLIQAMLSDEFEEQHTIRPDGRLSRRQRIRGAFQSWSSSSRSTPGTLPSTSAG